MMKFLGKFAVLTAVMFTAASLNCFADDTGEVVALRQQVKDLTSKLDSLENKVAGLASAPRDRSTPVVPAVTAPEGGLIHTMQDITMSGYIDVEYNQNLDRQTTNNAAGVVPSVTNGVATGTSQAGGNPLRSFDNDQNTFTMNAAVLEFQKAPKPEGGVGFRADVMMGQNAELINLSTTGSNQDQFTFLQAYVDVVAPLNVFKDSGIFDDVIDIKVGRLLTLAGFEVVRSPDNWNVSRGLLFGLGQPITHTGARATYNLFNDKVTTYWGILNGWDNVVDNNQGKTWEMGFSTSPIEGVTWTTAMYYGPENNAQGSHRRYLMTNVAVWNLTDRLSLVGEIDFGNQNRVVINTAVNNEQTKNAQWHGYYAGARYKLTEKLAGAYRVELFRDDDTFRIGNPAGANVKDDHNVWEQTFTLD